MRIAMVGAGYVGLVSGACFADFGHEVVCVDKDAAKIAASARRPGADLRAGPRANSSSPTSAPAGFPSPPTSPRACAALRRSSSRSARRRFAGDGAADMRYVFQAAREIGEAIEVLRRRRQQVDLADRNLRRRSSG